MDLARRTQLYLALGAEPPAGGGAKAARISELVKIPALKFGRYSLKAGNASYF